MTTSKKTTDRGHRFYGRRTGRKIRPARKKLLADLLPRLAIGDNDAPASLEPAGLFSFAPENVVMEIGFGGGEHLAAVAQRQPDTGFIGAEPFINGVASLLSQIEAREIANIRIWPDDVRPLLERLATASLAKLYILFPDPWPKARHANRRMIGPENLDLFARVLAPGAKLQLATDDMGYVDWSLFHLCRHPDFVWTAVGAEDWRTPPADWVETRYEKKTGAQGRRPVFLSFRRTDR